MHGGRDQLGDMRRAEEHQALPSLTQDEGPVKKLEDGIHAEIEPLHSSWNVDV